MLRLLLLLYLSNVSSSEFQNKNKQNYRSVSYCYATDKNTVKYFATKTAYDFVHGNDDLEDSLCDCKPIQFWSINRHGTRLPGKKKIKDLEKLTEIQKQIINNYENEVPNSKTNGLCEQDLQLFKSWVWNKTITEDIATTLTVQGWKELRNLALRNKKKFPEVLQIDYSEKNYLFRYTKHERTESSFKAYAQGLFGTFDNIHGISFQNDTLIETYKNCKLWQETVDENPETYKEYNKFTKLKVFQQLIVEVSERLGFQYSLDLVQILDFYEMCRYEQAWYPKEAVVYLPPGGKVSSADIYQERKSAWCAAFTKKHLQLLEYAEDLQYYYDIGHGTLINKKVGCMPLQDLMRRFENAVNGVQSEPKSVHYFTHSASLQLLMTTMGMAKDKSNLTADNWNEQNDRLWRTSLIGPFAANINIVLYKCTGNNSYKVAFYVNEKMYKFPECSNNGMCSWETVKEKFSKIAEDCNLDFCKNKK